MTREDAQRIYNQAVDPERPMYEILLPLCEMNDTGQFGPLSHEEAMMTGSIIAEYVNMHLMTVVRNGGLPDETCRMLIELSRDTLLEHPAFTIAVARGFRAVVNALEEPEETDEEITDEIDSKLIERFRAAEEDPAVDGEH